MKRRGLLLALAGLLVIAIAITYLMWFRPDTSPAPATRESLAAVAVDVLGIEPTSYEPDPERELGVGMTWRPDGSTNPHHLDLAIEGPDFMSDHPCESDCVTWQVGADEIRMDWDNLHVESDPGFLALSVVRDGEVRLLVYSGADIEGDPRENTDLPIPVSKLTEVILDDRFASTTTKEMTSVELDKWPAE